MGTLHLKRDDKISLPLRCRLIELSYFLLEISLKVSLTHKVLGINMCVIRHTSP